MKHVIYYNPWDGRVVQCGTVPDERSCDKWNKRYTEVKMAIVAAQPVNPDDCVYDEELGALRHDPQAKELSIEAVRNEALNIIRCRNAHKMKECMGMDLYEYMLFQKVVEDAQNHTSTVPVPVFLVQWIAAGGMLVDNETVDLAKSSIFDKAILIRINLANCAQTVWKAQRSIKQSQTSDKINEIMTTFEQELEELNDA